MTLTTPTPRPSHSSVSSKKTIGCGRNISLLQRLRTYGETRGLAFGAFAEASTDVHTLLTATAAEAATRHWRAAGAASRAAALSTYTAHYRRRWGATAALAGARLRVARKPYVIDARGCAAATPAGTADFDPADATQFSDAAPSLDSLSSVHTRSHAFALRSTPSSRFGARASHPSPARRASNASGASYVATMHLDGIRRFIWLEIEGETTAVTPSISVGRFLAHIPPRERRRRKFRPISLGQKSGRR